MIHFCITSQNCSSRKSWFVKLITHFCCIHCWHHRVSASVLLERRSISRPASGHDMSVLDSYWTGKRAQQETCRHYMFFKSEQS